MFVIFLDYDGVINTTQIYKEKPDYLKEVKMIKRDGYYFDICSSSDGRVSNTQAVLWLDYLCHLYNLKIVISSTWRLGNFERAKESLYNSGLSKEIEILGRTPNSTNFRRGLEIKSYLEEHPEIVNFIILDDDIEDMSPYEDHVIKTNSYEGLTFKIFIEIVEKLKEYGLDKNE